MTTAEFSKRTAIVVAIALVPILVWFFFDVLLIAVGAILIATLLRLLADPLARWGRLPESLALILSGLIILAFAIGGGLALFGTKIGFQLQDVLNRADAAMAGLTTVLQGSQLGRLILSHVQSETLSIPSLISGVFTVSVSFLEALGVTIIAGVYLAAQPELYRSGLSKLFPRRWRANANETINDIGIALRLWMLGQLIEMLIVGILSLIAVWIIGLPSPLALGVIAATTEFIPYLGPIIGAIPAVLVAATYGLHAVLWTILAYLIIHQVEGDVLIPIIQRHMVFIPPAVMLLAIVTIGFVFGTVAIIFAAPIAVILFVAINKLYVRDSLGEITSLPGEKS